MGGIRGLEPVPAGQGGRKFSSGLVDRTQVQPGEQGGEDADLVDGTVAQRPAEDLREQQDRAKARRRRSRGPEQCCNLLAQVGMRAGSREAWTERARSSVTASASSSSVSGTLPRRGQSIRISM